MIRAIVLWLVLVVSSPAIAAEQVIRHTFGAGDVSYDVTLIKPDREPPRALLLLLHGYGDTSKEILDVSNFRAYVQQHGLMVVAPQAQINPVGQSHWNVGTEGETRDDAGALVSLTKEIQEVYDIPPDATFVAGFSNGGFMAYRLACQTSDVFGAIAVVAGTITGSDWRACNKDNVTPLLHIHGRLDDIVPIDGSMPVEDGWGGAPPVKKIVRHWARWLGADTRVPSQSYSDGERMTFLSLDNLPVVELVRLEGFGHDWPQGFEDRYYAAQDIWRFFEEHLP